jgi:hypothetical protein
MNYEKETKNTKSTLHRYNAIYYGFSMGCNRTYNLNIMLDKDELYERILVSKAIERARKRYRRKQWFKDQWKQFKRNLQGLANAADHTLKNL